MLPGKLIKFINNKDGDFLIIGSPGTGKTHTLIETVKFLAEEKKIDPGKILVLSFNRRWSKMLRDRASLHIGRSIFEIPITTFFSFCTDFLEKVNLLLDFKPGQITVMTAPGQWQLLTEVISRLDKDNYPLTSRYINGNSFVASSYIQEVFDFILRAQENLISPRRLSDKFTPFFNAQLSEITGIYMHYKQELISKGLYNYGRLLEDTVSILKTNDNLRQFFSRKYEFILVDELQEINKAQLEIVRSLSDRNCIFFGNDDESIYSFRGSAINNFNRLYNELAESGKKHSDIFTLNKNFRSSSIINDLCNRFIGQNSERIGKKSVTSKGKADEHDGDMIVRELKTTLDEVNFICEKIKDLHVYKKIKLEEICIIIKGRGYKTRLLENVLTRNKINFIRRNSRALLDNFYVQYVINFLRLIDRLKIPENSGDEDESALNTLMENFLISDFTNLSSILIKNLSRKNGSLWNFIKSLSRDKKAKKRKDKNQVEDKLVGLYEFIKNFLRISSSPDLNCYDFVMKFITDKRTGIMKLIAGNGINKPIEGKKGLISILGDYLESIKEFTQENTGRNGIRDYLVFLEDVIENNFLEEIEESTKEFMFEGSVNILSYHQVKGLEFEAVFLPFVNKNYLPSVFGINQLYDMQVFNYMSGEPTLSLKELKDIHMQEERKLFYTGMTRAKNYLFITSNKFEGQSLFFEEINKFLPDLKKRKKIKNRYTDKRPISRTELKKNWLERKRATALTYKLLKGLRVNNRYYLEKLYYLKHIYPPDIWWSLRNETENTGKPFEIFPAAHSYSSLNSYMQCPFRYKIRYFIRIADKRNLNFIIGSIYHRILKLFYDDKSAGFKWERLEEIISKVFGENIFEFEHIKNELENKAKEDFRVYLNNHLPEFPEKSIMEKGFEFKMGNDSIKGIIDQINLIDDSTIEIVDFKSGQKKTVLKDLENEIQLKLYNLAIQSSKDLMFLRDKKSILKYIFLSDTKDPVVTIAPGHFASGDFEDFIRSLINNIKNEHFEAEPESSYICSDCDYKILCPGHNAG